MYPITYFISLGLAFTGLMVIYYLARQRFAPSPLYQLETGEYDFMSDETSLQSRLDLAYAYIEMGHIDQAKLLFKSLRDVTDYNIRSKALQALEKYN